MQWLQTALIFLAVLRIWQTDYSLRHDGTGFDNCNKAVLFPTVFIIETNVTFMTFSCIVNKPC